MAQYLKQRGIDEKAYNKKVTTQAELTRSEERQRAEGKSVIQ